MSCLNCGKCCQYSTGFLGPGDKEAIAKFLNITEKELESKHLEKTNMFGTEAWRPKHPKPFGPCVFFDKIKHCTIHKVKPLLCKLGNCQEDVTMEFYKKYFVKNNKQSKEEWQICQEVKKND